MYTTLEHREVYSFHFLYICVFVKEKNSDFVYKNDL